MQINELLHPQQLQLDLDVCSQFITASKNRPIYKTLLRSYNDIHHVKVRQHKTNSILSVVFNEAFSKQYSNLLQRSVITTGNLSLLDKSENKEPFYIFPTNGYRFLYCKDVQQATNNFCQSAEQLFERFNDTEQAIKTIADLLKFNYKDNDLQEGIDTGAEIIFYNISSFLAIRVSVVDSYSDAIALFNN